jgi:mRNA interferase MazF
MSIKKYDIWLADLNPQIGTEPGKVRPVLIIQSDLLNGIHPSTLICPITTNVISNTEILRLNLRKELTKLTYNCDILIDQIRSIDNNRLIKKFLIYHPN